MPITGLSETRRLPRQLKIRLGSKEANRSGGGEHPVEVDYFVFDRDDAANADKDFVTEVMDAYPKKPKALRLMLPFEVEARNPSNDDEIVLNLNNRAYGSNRGLRCKGTGNSRLQAGVAEVGDKAWADAIAAKAGAGAPKELPNGRFGVVCMGQDCPKYLLLDDAGKKVHDADAACKRVVILRAFLLHPTKDRNHADYCRVLGAVEIASGSINSTIDIQSGLAAMRPFTGGRTSGVPFTLLRRPTWTYRPNKIMHFPCQVVFDPKEVQEWAIVPLNQVFLSPQVRAEQMALRQAEVDFDSVKDLLPRGLHPKLLGAAPEGEPTIEPADTAEAPNPDLDQDRDEAIKGAADAATTGGEVGEEQELDREVSTAERNRLKALASEAAGHPAEDAARGPYPEAGINLLRDLAKQAHQEIGTWDRKAEDGTYPAQRQPFSTLTIRHARLIEARLTALRAEQKPAALQGELIDPDDLPPPAEAE